MRGRENWKLSLKQLFENKPIALINYNNDWSELAIKEDKQKQPNLPVNLLVLKAGICTKLHFYFAYK